MPCSEKRETRGVPARHHCSALATGWSYSHTWESSYGSPLLSPQSPITRGITPREKRRAHTSERQRHQNGALALLQGHAHLLPAPRLPCLPQRQSAGKKEGRRQNAGLGARGTPAAAAPRLPASPSQKPGRVMHNGPGASCKSKSCPGAEALKGPISGEQLIEEARERVGARGGARAEPQGSPSPPTQCTSIPAAGGWPRR